MERKSDKDEEVTAADSNSKGPSKRPRSPGEDDGGEGAKRALHDLGAHTGGAVAGSAGPTCTINDVGAIPHAKYKGRIDLVGRLIIPETVASFGHYSFKGCSGLTSVTIPDTVTAISKGAFCGCSGLTSVTIPSGVANIGYRAFQGCTGLTSVTIPSSVASIGDAAFYGCTGLISVTVPNSVSYIFPPGCKVIRQPTRQFDEAMERRETGDKTKMVCNVTGCNRDVQFSLGHTFGESKDMCAWHATEWQAEHREDKGVTGNGKTSKTSSSSSSSGGSNSSTPPAATGELATSLAASATAEVGKALKPALANPEEPSPKRPLSEKKTSASSDATSGINVAGSNNGGGEGIGLADVACAYSNDDNDDDDDDDNGISINTVVYVANDDGNDDSDDDSDDDYMPVTIIQHSKSAARARTGM